MKTLSALLLLALGLTPLSFGAPPKAKAPAAPAAPVAPAAEAPAGEQLDEKNLVGILVPRDNGGFINLKVDSGKFTMTFFDADKKAIAPDVTKATVRYRKNKNESRHLLQPIDGKSLQAPTPVARPYHFNGLHIVLFDDNEETAVEAYNKNFRQTMPGDGEGTPVDEMTPEQIQKVKK